MPPPGRPRRLGLLDLILVVAAFAVWLAWTRAYPPIVWDNGSIWSFRNGSGMQGILKYQGGYFLILSSLTLLIVRIRGPRPPRRRLWRQPGLAASAGAVVGFSVGCLRSLAEWATIEIPTDPTMYLDFSDQSNHFGIAESFVGPGVAGAWLALILIGRWRSERGTIDRLGRLVGVLWLLEFCIAEEPTAECWRALLRALGYR